MQPHKKTRLTDPQPTTNLPRRLILQHPELHHVAQTLRQHRAAAQRVGEQLAVGGDLFGAGVVAGYWLRLGAILFIALASLQTVEPGALANRVDDLVFQDGGEPASQGSAAGKAGAA